LSKGSRNRTADIERFRSNIDEIDWSDSEERAAILEYDGQLTRVEAEKIAGLPPKKNLFDEK